MADIEEVVRDNVNEALEQADELLKKAEKATEADAKILREKAKKYLARANENLKKLYDKTSVGGRKVCSDVNECVHEDPWRAVGVAAVLGVVLGVLIARK